MENVFFDHWSVLLRTATIGVSAYGCLIALLRLSGKRTLAKMNAFDLVVTVSMGSMLASLLVSKDVALAQGVLAFGVLIGLQYAVSWSSVRAPWVRRLVTGEPTLLLHRGAFLPDALRRSRVTESEVRAAVRSAGCASMADAHAVVLETDGSFSVVRTGGAHGTSSLADVRAISVPADEPA
jgi:uncharacterized membrane protein YcaP (DUF421 family)